MPVPGEKEPEQIAEEIINEADSDENVDDLLRGTEVYEEEDGDVEDAHTEELDFEPRDSASVGFDSFDDGPIAAQDAYEPWD